MDFSVNVLMLEMVFDGKSENYWKICYYGVIPNQEKDKDKTKRCEILSEFLTHAKILV